MKQRFTRGVYIGEEHSGIIQSEDSVPWLTKALKGCIMKLAVGASSAKPFVLHYARVPVEEGVNVMEARSIEDGRGICNEIAGLASEGGKGRDRPGAARAHRVQS